MLDLIARHEKFPHHKHTENEVCESTEISLDDVLGNIVKKITN